MKRLSFDSFIVDDANREAARICRGIADLRPVSPMPVLLLGDKDSGKTHLLCAILDAVRTDTANVGLAYIRENDIPDAVLSFTRDPAPLLRKEQGILLVDQLESFAERIDDLEAIIRLFLDHKRCVVLASNVHPDRLPRLTPDLRRICVSGRIVPIAPRDVDAPAERPRQTTGAEAPDRRARLPLDADSDAERQSDEIMELRSLIRRLGPGDDPGGLAELDRVKRENEELRRMLRSGGLDASGAAAELHALQAENDALRDERDRLTQQLAASEDAVLLGATLPGARRRSDEIESLREELQRVQAERARIEETRAQREQELAKNRGAASDAAELQRLRDETARLGGEATAARREAGRLQEILAARPDAETVSRLQQRVRELEAASDANARAHTPREDAAAATERVNALLERLTAERKELSDQANAAELRVARLSELTHALAALPVASEHLLSPEIQARLRAGAAAQARLAETQRALAQTQADRDCIVAEHGRIQTERDDARRTANERREALEQATAALARAEERITLMARELAAARRHASRQRSAAEAARRDAHAMERQVASLRRCAGASHRTLTDSAAAFGELRAELGRLLASSAERAETTDASVARLAADLARYDASAPRTEHGSPDREAGAAPPFPRTPAGPSCPAPSDGAASPSAIAGSLPDALSMDASATSAETDTRLRAPRP